MKTFITEFQVYFEDISPSGYIHMEKLAEWMSMAREQYFKTTCPEHLKFIDGPVKMFTTNISIRITEQSRWADTIKVVLTCANIKKISFQMHINFINKRIAQVIAVGIQKVAFINIATKNFTDVPDDMKTVIVNYTETPK